MKKILLVIATVALMSSCAKDESTGSCNAGDPNIIGATCSDGTTSSATGSGACSHHGGVSHWNCN